jgi:hypothetical protein
LHEQPTLNTAKSHRLQVGIWKSSVSKWEGQNFKHDNHYWKATVVVKGLKITGGCSNLYLGQNITPIHSQKNNENSLECELEEKNQEIEKVSNPLADEI